MKKFLLPLLLVIGMIALTGSAQQEDDPGPIETHFVTTELSPNLITLGNWTVDPGETSNWHYAENSAPIYSYSGNQVTLGDYNYAVKVLPSDESYTIIVNVENTEQLTTMLKLIKSQYTYSEKHYVPDIIKN